MFIYIYFSKKPVDKKNDEFLSYNIGSAKIKRLTILVLIEKIPLKSKKPIPCGQAIGITLGHKIEKMLLVLQNMAWALNVKILP